MMVARKTSFQGAIGVLGCKFGGRIRRLVALAFASSLLASLAPVIPTHAEAIKLGSITAANVGPVYVALAKGYFAAEGLEVELVSFDAAQPVAVAVASGSIDFGVSATSGGLFALAGQGPLRIISGFYSEAPTFHNFAVAASNHAYEAGLKSYKDLANHSVATSQIGSPVHYSLALLAEKYDVDLQTIRLLPLQGIPNMVSALVGNQADATVITATAITPVLQAGQAKLLGWIGDETPWQTAVTYASVKTLNERSNTVQAFLRAFRNGAKDYHDAFTGPDEKRADGPTAPEILAIVAKYVNQTPEQVRLGVAYVDPGARLDVADIRHQVEWFKSQKMLKDDFNPSAVMDMRYVIERPTK
jgi:NitT/TauT family transport system substrate-binding protein